MKRFDELISSGCDVWFTPAVVWTSWSRTDLTCYVGSVLNATNKSFQNGPRKNASYHNQIQQSGVISECHSSGSPTQSIHSNVTWIGPQGRSHRGGCRGHGPQNISLIWGFRGVYILKLHTYHSCWAILQIFTKCPKIWL